MPGDYSIDRISMDNALLLVDAARQSFDMLEIQNRRFMYNPDTCTLILGRQNSAKNVMAGSHAEDHGNSGAAEPFDSFLRGWIGTGSEHKQGVIHFAPPIDTKDADRFVDGYNTLQMFRENGAGPGTVIRGFGDTWEQPLSDILPGFNQSRTNEREVSNMEYYGIWAMRSGNSVLGAAEAWSKRDGIPEVFTTKEDAARQAAQYNKNTASANVRYSVREMEPELAQTSQRQQNTAIAQAIDKAVQESNYESFHYDLKGAAEKVIGEYGAERVSHVLANVILTHDYDARYSAANKTWAQEFDIIPDKGLYCNTHPYVLNGFIDRAKEITAKIEAERSAEMVGSFNVTRSIQFDNDRGFAYGENPKAAQPFATWQFTSENGVRDHYWGHYHSGQDAALTDYQNRVNEYMADNPSLKVVVDNPLAAAEMGTEQNYNMLDGLHNNMEAAKADLTDGQTLEEIKELAPEMLPVEETPELPKSSLPRGRKFENVDVIAALGAVVAKNTVGYKTDFEYDKEHFIKAAESHDPEDRNLLWLSRQNGTECFTERDAFISTTEAHNHWTYYEGQSSELVPFAVEITGMENGRPMGNLYELDHSLHVRQVKNEVLPPESVLLTFKDGEQKRFAYDEYDGHFQQIQQTHGRVVGIRHEVADESALQATLANQRTARARFPARSFDAFIKKLPQQERPSVAEKLDAAKKAVKPPSADKKPPAKSGPEL